MSRRNRNKKEAPIEGISTNKQEKNRGSIFVDLPVPKSDVLGKLVNDALIYRYIESVEKIAKLESETLIKVASKKFTAIWKALLIACVFIIVILLLMFGQQFKFHWGNIGLDYNSNPKTQERK